MRFWPFGRKARQANEVDGSVQVPGDSSAVPPAGNRPAAEPSGRAEPAPTDDATTRLATMPLDDAQQEHAAIALLDAHRASPDEGRLLGVALGRLSTRTDLERLRVRAASILVDRGEPARAEQLLEPGTSPEALLLGAELAERRHELTLAITRLERVLARDLDYPGVRERHRRLRGRAGLTEPPPRDAGATALLPADSSSTYRLLREVARGGAGTVYEALDPVLDRALALKVMHDARRQQQSLLHEMRMTAELSGPGVLRVFDADPDEGWLAYEWAALGSLRDHLRAATLDELGPTDHWLRALASALARVHDAGVVHGDVKPANMLFLASGELVLSDFGLAKHVGETLVGGSMGYLTADRYHPTQAAPWHDVYAFGRVLEDVFVKAPDLQREWGTLARRCLGPREQAPTDGQALCQLLPP